MASIAITNNDFAFINMETAFRKCASVLSFYHFTNLMCMITIIVFNIFLSLYLEVVDHGC